MVLKDFLKLKGLPHYDPVTDEIKNCVEGSLTWYHEKRHQQQSRIPILQKIELYTHAFGYYFGAVMLLFLCWSFRTNWFVLMAIGWTPYTIYMGCLEIDANIYSFKKYLRKK